MSRSRTVYVYVYNHPCINDVVALEELEVVRVTQVLLMSCSAHELLAKDPRNYSALTMAVGGQLIGALMAVTAAVISNIGTNVQKASHTADQKLSEEEHVPYFKRFSWWTGFICTLIGSILDFVALGLASQALVAALGGGTTLITNVVVARFYNHEQTYWYDYVGVVFIVIGAAMFAVMAESKPENLNYEKQFFKDYNLVYLTCQLVLIFTMLASITRSRLAQWRRDYYGSLLRPLEAKIKKLESRLKVNEEKVNGLVELENTRSPGDLARSLSSMSIGSDSMGEANEYRHRDKYIYVACAGAIGALSILFGGVTSSMMQDGFAEAFQQWFFYFALVLMIVSVVTQTHLQNRGLELGDATAVFPVFEAFWISFGVVSGLVYYDTPDATWWSELKQAAGVIPMLIGTFFLFLHGYKPKEERDKEDLQATLMGEGGSTQEYTMFETDLEASKRESDDDRYRAGARGGVGEVSLSQAYNPPSPHDHADI